MGTWNVFLPWWRHSPVYCYLAARLNVVKCKFGVWLVNRFTANTVKVLHIAILVKPTIFNFWLSKIKNDWLYQYGPERFEYQQYGTAGVEGVRTVTNRRCEFACLKVTDGPHSSVMFEVSSVDAMVGKECQYCIVGFRVSALVHVHCVALDTYTSTPISDTEIDSCKKRNYTQHCS